MQGRSSVRPSQRQEARPGEARGARSLHDRLPLTHAGLGLRLAQPGDEDFLDTLLRDEIGHSYAPVAPPRELLQRLVATQRRAESDRWAKRYRGCEFLVILKDGVPIGRLAIAHEITEFGSCLRLADMALLRYHQTRGYGRALLCDIIDGARAMGFFRVNVTVYAANEVFIRLLKTVGFRSLGTLDPTSHVALFFPLP